MADHIISGILKDPAGEFSVGDKIRFTHTTTTGNTIMGAQSQFTVPPDGSYTIALQYGIIKVEYLDIKAGSWRNLGNITINADTAPATLPGLLNALVPPTDSTLLQIQSLVADAEQSATDSSDDADRAEAAAQSIVHDNLLINGGFDVWQRGTYSADGDFLADRWYLRKDVGTGGTTIQTRQSYANDYSDPNSEYFLRHTAANHTDYCYLRHRIELTNNVGFWSERDFTFAVDFDFDNQVSMSVVIRIMKDNNTAKTIYTSGWETVTNSRQTKVYSFTGQDLDPIGFNPSADDYINIYIYYRDVTTEQGIPDGNYDFHNVKLEQGSVFTGFTRTEPATELMKCQRYYQKITNTLYAYPITDAGLFRNLVVTLPTTMRSNPAVSATYSNWYVTPSVNSQLDSVSFFGYGLATNISTIVSNLTLDAEL